MARLVRGKVQRAGSTQFFWNGNFHSSVYDRKIIVENLNAWIYEELINLEMKCNDRKRKSLIIFLGPPLYLQTNRGTVGNRGKRRNEKESSISTGGHCSSKQVNFRNFIEIRTLDSSHNGFDVFTPVDIRDAVLETAAGVTFGRAEISAERHALLVTHHHLE